MMKRRWRLSAALYCVVQFGILIVGLGGLIAILLTAIAIGAPEVLAGATLRIGGGALDPAVPGAAATLFAILVAAVTAIGFILHRLSLVLETVKAGTPFAAANVARLRVIAWVLVVLAVAEPVVVLAVPERLRVATGIGDGRIDIGTLLAALVVLVLAEVFDEGLRLREDVDATI